MLTSRMRKLRLGVVPWFNEFSAVTHKEGLALELLWDQGGEEPPPHTHTHSLMSPLIPHTVSAPCPLSSSVLWEAALLRGRSLVDLGLDSSEAPEIFPA